MQSNEYICDIQNEICGENFRFFYETDKKSVPKDCSVFYCE